MLMWKTKGTNDFYNKMYTYTSCPHQLPLLNMISMYLASVSHRDFKKFTFMPLLVQN
jgi:hypothetical protein